MKRYRVTHDLEMEEVPDGEWVWYEDMLLHQRPLPRIEETLLKENVRLKELNRGMAFVLSLILPMAKGYADKNKVGNNANMIRRAEEILIQAERMGEGE